MLIYDDQVMRGASIYVALSAATQWASAQYPPPVQYSNILASPLNQNISISYKSPAPGTCTTVFTTQKQYTGYIGLPPFTLAPIQQNYSINTFFWFIEARQNPETAPLTIYINGGPGASSMFGLFEETGPCEVVQMSDGTYGTQSRMWGWDRSSNIIFIDQPDQVGLSYDTLTNASYNLITGNYTSPPTGVPLGQPAYSFLNGTFSSHQQTATANTTEIAAHAMWHFLQSWLSAFPQYNPGKQPNTTTVTAAGINLFTESYGGKYGPVFASFFEQQNARRANGSLPSNSTLAIKLSSLGIVNGLIDDGIQDYYYPFFAYNNTYGIQAVSQVDELNSLQIFKNICLPAINACRSAMNSTGTELYGDVNSINSICQQAQFSCNNVSRPYLASGRNVYDIRIQDPSPFPPAAYQEYLNMAAVQTSIGARVNYTEQSTLVQNAFISTGDSISGLPIHDLAYLLKLGVRVALLNGDADYVCNWLGGEAVSLALAALLPDYPIPTSSASVSSSSLASLPSATSSISSTSYASKFPAAGYADIVVNSSYVGGAVRQYGNLSFSRIYDAGHFVPFYQPETAFTVFTRIILGTEISTGETINLSNFSSTGPQNATHTNSAPTQQPSPTCWIRDMENTCTDADIAAIKNGQGVVEQGVWYADVSDYTPPKSSVTAGVPGTPVSRSSSATKGGTSTAPTGVYTATATPSPTGGAAPGFQVLGSAGIVGVVLGWLLMFL